MWKEAVCVLCGMVYSHYSKNNLDEFKCSEFKDSGGYCGGKLKYTGKDADAQNLDKLY